MRTLASWQRSSMACVIFGVALAKGLGVNMVVGVIFCVLGIFYGISTSFNHQVQVRSMRHDSYRVNSRLVLATSIFTLVCYGLILAFMDKVSTTTEKNNNGGGGGIEGGSWPIPIHKERQRPSLFGSWGKPKSRLEWSVQASKVNIGQLVCP